MKVQVQERFYKAQLHCHSTNSDGSLTPAEVITAYKALSYDILCISDHNYLTDISAYNDSFFLTIAGEELTSDVHMNAFFLDSCVDVTSLSHQEMIDSSIAQNALVALNHYLRPGNIISDSEMVALQAYHFLEIYNHGCDSMYPDDQLLWDMQLSRGRRVFGIATDDMHNVTNGGIDGGWIMLRLDSLCKNAAYNALMQGDFYSSTGVYLHSLEFDNNTLCVSCDSCDTIIFYGQNHTILSKVAADTAAYTLTNNDMYVRAMLYNDTTMQQEYKRAWTQAFYNPFYVSIQEQKTEKGFSLYPNPTSSYLNIVLEESYLQTNNQLCTRIYTENGKCMYEKYYTPHKHIFLDISFLHKAIYLLEIKGESSHCSSFLVY